MNTNNYRRMKDLTLVAKAVAATATAATGVFTLVKSVKSINNNCKQKETTNEAKVQEETKTNIEKEETETDTQEKTE